MKCAALALATLLATAATQAGRAAPIVVPIGPGSTTLSLTVFAMGLFPQPGHFSDFAGTLTLDSDRPGSCQVTLTVRAASLLMADLARTKAALGPKLLDAQRFPTLSYVGACHEGSAAGSLTMHGVTRPLTLATTRHGILVTASGNLHREDYGVIGLPGLIGRRIELRLSVTLPLQAAATLLPGPPPQPGSKVSAAPFMQ